MKRNTTLTLMLMIGSVAAAVAAPELPADLATIAAAERIAISAALPAASRDKGEAAQASQPPRTASCYADVTAPYRLAHHGSLKLDPVCKLGTT